MMLAPVYLLDGFNGDIGEDTDYIIAQKDGYFGRDCSRYHHECPASLFSVRFGILSPNLRKICRKTNKCHISSIISNYAL